MPPDDIRPPEHVPRVRRISRQLLAAALLGDRTLFSLRPDTMFRPWQWTIAFLLVVVGDYLTGPFIPSAILFYFIPIGMAAWSGARWWSIGLAVLWPPLRLAVIALWGIPWDRRLTVEDTVVNAVVSVAFASLVWRLVDRERKLRMLRGLLPICGFCKRIRGDTGWQPVEVYITDHSEALFSHTFCPECAGKHYGAYLDR